jgi:Protease subunit of ATP-dependent Clp proteases
MPSMPYVIKRSSDGERSFDIYSRLLDDRIVFLDGEVNDVTADIIIAQFLHLSNDNSNKDISFYINSPGGSVSAGLAILDTMNFIKPNVSTICVGTAASMGAVLMSAGAKGKRFILPHSEIMIHQPLGGSQGQASDMEIAMNHMKRTKETLIKILSENTGKDYDTVWKDCDRDNWLNAEEAVAYGIVDQIVTHQ